MHEYVQVNARNNASLVEFKIMFLYAKYSLGLIAYPREYAIYACVGAKLLKVHELQKKIK